MKIALCVAALAAVIGQPIVADATDMPTLPWPANLGVIGGLMFLLFHLTTKTGPRMVERMEEHHERVCDKICKSQEESTARLCEKIDSHVELIRDAVARQ